MIWLRNLLLAIRRERNRRKRWAYRNRIRYTWPPNDWRDFQHEFEAQERRARQS